MTKTALITGATSGIGKVTALELAKRAFQIIFTSRDKQKGQDVKQELIKESGNDKIEVLECDLSSLESVKNLAKTVISKYPKLDVLINNAGTWETQRKLSKDGIELTFAVNHLAPFLLTNLLLDLIKKSAPARIVNVSSNLHGGKINFEDIEFKKGYDPTGNKPYTQSKLSNILFTKKLAKLLEETNVTANALHPGIIKTNLIRNAPGFMKLILGMFQDTPEEGAKTSIYLASSDEVENITGQYFAKSKVKDSGDYSNDPEIAEKLWHVSLEYVKDFM